MFVKNSFFNAGLLIILVLSQNKICSQDEKSFLFASSLNQLLPDNTKIRIKSQRTDLKNKENSYLSANKNIGQSYLSADGTKNQDSTIFVVQKDPNTLALSIALASSSNQADQSLVLEGFDDNKILFAPKTSAINNLWEVVSSLDQNNFSLTDQEYFKNCYLKNSKQNALLTILSSEDTLSTSFDDFPKTGRKLYLFYETNDKVLRTRKPTDKVKRIVTTDAKTGCFSYKLTKDLTAENILIDFARSCDDAKRTSMSWNDIKGAPAGVEKLFDTGGFSGDIPGSEDFMGKLDKYEKMMNKVSGWRDNKGIFTVRFPEDGSLNPLDFFAARNHARQLILTSSKEEAYKAMRSDLFIWYIYKSIWEKREKDNDYKPQPLCYGDKIMIASHKSGMTLVGSALDDENSATTKGCKQVFGSHFDLTDEITKLKLIAATDSEDSAFEYMWFYVKGPHSDTNYWNCKIGEPVKNGDTIRLQSVVEERNLTALPGLAAASAKIVGTFVNYAGSPQTIISPDQKNIVRSTKPATEDIAVLLSKNKNGIGSKNDEFIIEFGSGHSDLDVEKYYADKTLNKLGSYRNNLCTFQDFKLKHQISGCYVWLDNVFTSIDGSNLVGRPSAIKPDGIDICRWWLVAKKPFSSPIENAAWLGSADGKIKSTDTANDKTSVSIEIAQPGVDQNFKIKKQVFQVQNNNNQYLSVSKSQRDGKFIITLESLQANASNIEMTLHQSKRFMIRCLDLLQDFDNRLYLTLDENNHLVFSQNLDAKKDSSQAGFEKSAFEIVPQNNGSSFIIKKGSQVAVYDPTVARFVMRPSTDNSTATILNATAIQGKDQDLDAYLQAILDEKNAFEIICQIATNPKKIQILSSSEISTVTSKYGALPVITKIIDLDSYLSVLSSAIDAKGSSYNLDTASKTKQVTTALLDTFKNNQTGKELIADFSSKYLGILDNQAAEFDEQLRILDQGLSTIQKNPDSFRKQLQGIFNNKSGLSSTYKYINLQALLDENKNDTASTKGSTLLSFWLAKNKQKIIAAKISGFTENDIKNKTTMLDQISQSKTPYFVIINQDIDTRISNISNILSAASSAENFATTSNLVTEQISKIRTNALYASDDQISNVNNLIYKAVQQSTAIANSDQASKIFRVVSANTILVNLANSLTSNNAKSDDIISMLNQLINSKISICYHGTTIQDLSSIENFDDLKQFLLSTLLNSNVVAKTEEYAQTIGGLVSILLYKNPSIQDIIYESNELYKTISKQKLSEDEKKASQDFFDNLSNKFIELVKAQNSVYNQNDINNFLLSAAMLSNLGLDISNASRNLSVPSITNNAITTFQGYSQKLVKKIRSLAGLVSNPEWNENQVAYLIDLYNDAKRYQEFSPILSDSSQKFSLMAIIKSIGTLAGAMQSQNLDNNSFVLLGNSLKKWSKETLTKIGK